nr:hypothetical protein [Nostoc sp. FACHB-190]
MTVEGGDKFTCSDIPEFDAVITSSRSNGFTIGAKFYTNDRIAIIKIQESKVRIIQIIE